MSEPTRTTSAEKRQEIHKDESARALRASLPITASSHSSSPRPDEETQEQLIRSAKQARNTKTGVETLQDVSLLFPKGHCEHQRNGFVQVRMASMRRSNKKRLLKKKDGERNLHFASCPPAALRETRRAEWSKWMKFNAGAILTDQEVRQLTEAGCEIYPMWWIEIDKHAHLRKDNDYVSVLAKYKSRLVSCGNFETTEGLRTDSRVGDVGSRKYHLQLVCTGTSFHSRMQFHERILARTRN